MLEKLLSALGQPITTTGMSTEEIKKMILATEGRTFEVVFRKRTTGSQRTMKAQTRPRIGGKKSLQMEQAGLLAVWDLDANGWRSIPLDSVSSFRLLDS